MSRLYSAFFGGTPAAAAGGNTNTNANADVDADVGTCSSGVGRMDRAAATHARSKSTPAPPASFNALDVGLGSASTGTDSGTAGGGDWDGIASPPSLSAGLRQRASTSARARAGAGAGTSVQLPITAPLPSSSFSSSSFGFGATPRRSRTASTETTSSSFSSFAFPFSSPRRSSATAARVRPVEVYSYTTQSDLTYETGFGFDVLFGVQLGLARRRHVMEIELKDLRRPERIGRLPSEDHSSYLRSRGLPDRAPMQRQVSMLTYHRVAQGGAIRPRLQWPENRPPSERLWDLDEDDGGDDDYSFIRGGSGSGGSGAGSCTDGDHPAFIVPGSPGRSTGTDIHHDNPLYVRRSDTNRSLFLSPFLSPFLSLSLFPVYVTRPVRR